MDILLVIVIALVFLAVGWWLGRCSGDTSYRQWRNARGAWQLSRSLDEQPDEALEAILASVDVNTDTLDTHFAIGSLMRQRGEVERAIKVHRNLLSRSTLTSVQIQQAQLELALDFLKAGLLDRSEKLLLELIENSVTLRCEATRHLVEIYQEEQEWEKAILAAENCRRGVFSGDRNFLSKELSQFCCELADQALQQKSWSRAEKYLKRAAKYHKTSTRTHLLLGQLAEQQGKPDKALEYYQSIAEADNCMLPVALDALAGCYDHSLRYHEFAALLKQWLERFEDPHILPHLVRALAVSESSEAAYHEISQYLQQKPSAIGIRALMSIEENTADTDNSQPQQSGESAQNQLVLIRDMVDKLFNATPDYRCEHCGFSGNQLHWRCPGCRHWETVKPAHSF